MNKKYEKVLSTRNSLLMSIISLILCFAMLIGTTYAWFTDEVTSGVNKIVAGNLDIEVEYSKDGSNWADLQDSPSLFTGALWEPGHTEVVYLRVKNAGTLALKYDLKVSPISETGGINQEGNSFKLSDYIKFATVSADTLTTYTRETARAAVGDGVALNSGMLKSGEMQPKAAGTTELPTKYVTLVVYMPEDVGNIANYKTGTTAPEIDLGITVLATQLQSEADSFDDTYDKDLTNDTSVIYNYFPQVNVTGQLTISGTEVQKGSTAGNETTVEKLNDTQSKVTLASPEKVEENTAAKVEAVLKKADGDQQTGSMTLKVVKDDTANANFKTDSNKINTATQDSTTYQVTVKTEGVVAVPETEGKANFKVDLFIGKSRTNVKMYHNGTEMTKADTGAPDTFTYDATTGYVTMYVDEFSPFTAVYDMPVAAIGTTVYYTLKSAIDAAESGAVIKILKDIDNAEGMTVNSGKNFTVDFGGHTYTMNKPGAGSANTERNGFQLLKNSTIVFKNGTLALSEENLVPATVGKNIERMIQCYAALTLQDMTIDATNQYGVGNYVMSFNNMPVSITGNTSVILKDGAEYAFDADGNWDGYDRCRVTVDTTGTIEGSIELGNGYLDIKNVKTGGIVLCTECGTSETDGQAERCTITGGTFSSDPKAYVAEDYKAVDNGNGTWTVKLKVAPTPVNGVFTANSDEELADVIEEIKTNNNYWNTPVTIQLGAGIYTGEYHIFQYPTWNGIYYENPNTCDYYLKPGLRVDKDGNTFEAPESYSYIAFREGEYGVKKSMPNYADAPTTMITIKGTDGVKFDGVIHIWGFGYGVSGDVSMGADKVYTIIDGIDFEHEGSIDEGHYNLVCTGASANVQILNCNFKNTARIIIGKSAMGGGYSYNATVKDCTFKDTDSCIQGYLHGKVGFMFQNVTAENTGSFLNIQNGSGTEPIRMDNVTFTGGTGYFIRQQSDVNVIVTNSTIAFADDAAKGWAVEFRSNSTVLLDNCAVTGKKIIYSNTSEGTVQLKGTTPTDFERNSDKITITQVN